MEKETIDLTGFGSLWDKDGEATFEENLCKAFHYLVEKKLLDDKKQRYKICISRIKSKGDYPERYSTIEYSSILRLKNFWRRVFSKPFSVNQIEIYNEEKSNKFDSYEKVGDGRSAWGIYSASVRALKENREYEKLQKLPEQQREKETKRLEKRINYLVIS